MKDKKKAAAPRPSIARMVMGLIHGGRLDTKEGKEEALKVVSAVKKSFHKSKFGLTHYFWYLSRYRRQKERGLPLDRLVVVGGKAKAPKKAKAKKATRKPEAQAAAVS